MSTNYDMYTNYAVNEAGLFSLYFSEYLLAGYNPRMDDAIFPKKRFFNQFFTCFHGWK